MRYKITAEMEVNMRPGVCSSPSCGKVCASRNSAGQCDVCHNKQYFERRAQEKIEAAEHKAAGRKFWADRGIEVGEKLEALISSVFSPYGEMVYGIAKAGTRGAYVKVGRQKVIAGIFNKMKLKEVK